MSGVWSCNEWDLIDLVSSTGNEAGAMAAIRSSWEVVSIA